MKPAEYNLSIDQLRAAHEIAVVLSELRVQLHGLRQKLGMSDTMVIGRSDHRAEGGVAGYVQVKISPATRDQIEPILEAALRTQIEALEHQLVNYGVNPDFSAKPMTPEDEALILGALK